jgi:cysteine-rich secretory family protein
VNKKGEALAPVAPTLILGRNVFTFRAKEANRAAFVKPDDEFADREIFPRFKDVADGLRHLNTLRGKMNLPPVALDREASRAALLHIGYLERNGGNGHLERSDFPGYTREGAMAGLNAIGWHGGGSVTSAVDGHLSSLLHRMDLIDPRTTAVGIASQGERIWIHTECGEKRKWEGQGPVIFPGPEGRWMTGAYSGDNPDPRPEGYRSGCGLPITIAWYGSSGVRQVTANVFYGTTPIRCFKNDAERRELNTNHPAIRAVILPKDTLKNAKLVLTWEQAGAPCRIEVRLRIG